MGRDDLCEGQICYFVEDMVGVAVAWRCRSAGFHFLLLVLRQIVNASSLYHFLFYNLQQFCGSTMLRRTRTRRCEWHMMMYQGIGQKCRSIIFWSRLSTEEEKNSGQVKGGIGKSVSSSRNPNLMEKKDFEVYMYSNKLCYMYLCFPTHKRRASS